MCTENYEALQERVGLLGLIGLLFSVVVIQGGFESLDLAKPVIIGDKQSGISLKRC